MAQKILMVMVVLMVMWVPMVLMTVRRPLQTPIQATIPFQIPMGTEHQITVILTVTVMGVLMRAKPTIWRVQMVVMGVNMVLILQVSMRTALSIVPRMAIAVPIYREYLTPMMIPPVRQPISTSPKR